MANLYGLWDWVGMAPCMGPMSPVRAYSLWAGLYPEKLVKPYNLNKGVYLKLNHWIIQFYSPYHARLLKIKNKLKIGCFYK